VTPTAVDPATAASGAPLLELFEIRKSYPGVRALDDVSLTLAPGRVHALLGENGAGKSTLIKIVSGVEQPDRGAYKLFGSPAEIRNPREALKRGISVVHQERNLVPTFTVGENVLLDRVIGGAGRFVKRARIHADAIPYMDMVGLKVSPWSGVASLSSAQQQLIEIARALSTEAKILLLDEPTASISLREADSLLRTIRSLRERGTSIVYVSHKLEEIFEVCDVVNVLRDGKNAGPCLPLAGLSRDDLITRMVGRAHVVGALPTRNLLGREPVLEVADRPSEATVNGSSFVLRRGEILGWYGLVGSGRTELARAVVAADKLSGGSTVLHGKAVRIVSMAAALHRFGIGYVTENRQHEGLFLIHSIQRNIAATVWERLRNAYRFLLSRNERILAERYKLSLDIRAQSVAKIVGTLSGGNKQKVSLAKWLAADPRILFVDEPTVGIDIRTKYEIHQIIYQLAESGASIVLISSDMPEMIRLADRILVFRAGIIAGEIVNTKVYDEVSRKVMGLILGAPSSA
jgi:ribose transport system ATP-binding protein